MSARAVFAGAAAFCALATPAWAQETGVAPAPCLQSGEKIEGEFRWVDTRHAGTHQMMHVPFLVLDTPRCVRDEFGESEGRWVQLTLERKTDLGKLKPGDTIVVRAAYATPQTAWHIGDILANEALVLEEHKP